MAALIVSSCASYNFICTHSSDLTLTFLFQHKQLLSCHQLVTNWLEVSLTRSYPFRS